MENQKNIQETKVGQTVTIGRMKGKINPGDKIYRLSSKKLSQEAKESYRKENRKVFLNATVTIKTGEPLSIHITSCSNLALYKNLALTCNLDVIPEEAKNKPLDEETVLRQITKTASTPYEFKHIKVLLRQKCFSS